MKLLIITQKVDLNDDILGFFHDWLSEFAKHCEKLIVICLYLGEYNLPTNVKVLSLGKEQYLYHSHFLRRPISLYRFYKYLWQERKNYDKVLVHMNQIYVILGGIFWRLSGKKIGLWYAHGHVPIGLKIAERLTNVIFTSTASGCRLKSSKIKIVGQGININKFTVKSQKPKVKNEIFKIITVGRISPVKDYETLIKAVEILIKQGIKLKVDVIGKILFIEHQQYLAKLKSMVKDKGLPINFIGAVPNKEIVNYLKESNLFVNMSRTGSLDKAILEAMASQLPILTSNKAISGFLGEYEDMLLYPTRDYQTLANKIDHFYNLTSQQREKIGQDLRNIVIREHNLSGLVEKIINFLRK